MQDMSPESSRVLEEIQSPVEQQRRIQSQYISSSGADLISNDDLGGLYRQSNHIVKKHDPRIKNIIEGNLNNQVRKHGTDKKDEFLAFEEGSLLSKDMRLGSQDSTIKINVNSIKSHKSFYSENHASF